MRIANWPPPAGDETSAPYQYEIWAQHILSGSAILQKRPLGSANNEQIETVLGRRFGLRRPAKMVDINSRFAGERGPIGLMTLGALALLRVYDDEERPPEPIQREVWTHRGWRAVRLDPASVELGADGIGQAADYRLRPRTYRVLTMPVAAEEQGTHTDLHGVPLSIADDPYYALVHRLPRSPQEHVEWIRLHTYSDGGGL